MAFRRIRRYHLDARKFSGVKPIIDDLLEVIEGNGMTVRDWFEIMDQLAVGNMVTQSELSRGMRMLELHGKSTKCVPVLSPEKVETVMKRSILS